MTGVDLCALPQCDGVIGALPLNVFTPSSVSTPPLPLSAAARRWAHYAHRHRCHLHSPGCNVIYFTTTRQNGTQESRVVLMGQTHSDEDKRSLFSFPSKAGNGKSVPRRNHVLPGEEGLRRVGRSCQTLIRDSYSHLRVCVFAILLVCLCVRVSACVGNCQSICSL